MAKHISFWIGYILNDFILNVLCFYIFWTLYLLNRNSWNKKSILSLKSSSMLQMMPKDIVFW